MIRFGNSQVSERAWQLFFGGAATGGRCGVGGRAPPPLTPLPLPPTRMPWLNT